MKNASEQLSNVLESINKVKKTLRNKKYCYENCESEGYQYCSECGQKLDWSEYER